MKLSLLLKKRIVLFLLIYNGLVIIHLLIFGASMEILYISAIMFMIYSFVAITISNLVIKRKGIEDITTEDKVL